MPRPAASVVVFIFLVFILVVVVVVFEVVIFFEVLVVVVQVFLIRRHIGHRMILYSRLGSTPRDRQQTSYRRSEGRYLADVLAWNDEQLGVDHECIQWLLPLVEPSQFNPFAHLLTDEDIAAFRSEPLLEANLRQSFDRQLAFFGLQLAGKHVVEAENFATRISDIWTFPNHNWLRSTRILHSLSRLGQAPLAQAHSAWLEAAYKRHRFPVSAETFRYWTEAASPPRDEQRAR